MLVTHDSFAIPKQVKAAFEQESGLKLTILQGGDAGEMVNRALLTKGNPQGDVALRDRQQPALAGARRGPVRAVRAPAGSIRRCRAYRLDPSHSRDADRPRRRLPQRRQGLVRLARRRAAADRSTTSPQPRYKNLLVVENPATSTPGLAFMLATVAQFGESGWQDYWRELRANGVLVVDGWEEAYTARFSGAGGSKGKRPIVVSYATSPPAEVIFAKTPPKTPRRPSSPTAASARSSSPACSTARRTRRAPGRSSTSCSRSSSRRRCRRACSCCPVRDGTPLPEAFRKYAVSPPNPLELPAAEIGSNRDRWIDEWTQVVLR